MKYNVLLTHSGFKHRRGKELPTQEEFLPLLVMKNEEFGIQMILQRDQEFTLLKGQTIDISWSGLHDHLRVTCSAKGLDSNSNSVDVSDLFSLHLMDFVKDEEANEWISDILTDKDSIHCLHQEQGVFIEGKIPSDASYHTIELSLFVHHSKGYSDEQLLYEKTIAIQVQDFVLPDISQSDFYMDIWQHPCNWSRAYDVSYFSQSIWPSLTDIWPAWKKSGNMSAA